MSDPPINKYHFLLALYKFLLLFFYTVNTLIIINQFYLAIKIRHLLVSFIDES